MIDLLPDETKKVELREMREAYSLAADFANGSAAQNKVYPPGSRRLLTMELTCNLQQEAINTTQPRFPGPRLKLSSSLNPKP